MQVRFALAVLVVCLAAAASPGQQDALPTDAEDLAPDAKDLARTDRWAWRQSIRLADARGNQFATDRVQKATFEGVSRLKGEKIVWTFKVESVGSEKTGGPFKGLVPIEFPKFDNRHISLKFEGESRLYIKPEDWVAGLRRGDLIRVSATVSDVAKEGVSLTLRDITAEAVRGK